MHHVAQDVHVGVEMLEPGVGKAGADQTIGEFLALAHAQAAVVQVSAASSCGGEEVILGRVVDHRLSKHAVMLQGDRHGILLVAVQKVGRAIERVDNPDIFRVALSTALFCKNRMGRIGVQQGCYDGLLRSTIHLADVIGVRFLGDSEVIEIIGGTVDQIAGAASGLHRDGEHGMHNEPF